MFKGKQLNQYKQARQTLSLQEKSKVFSILVILLSYGFYFTQVLYSGDPLHPSHLAKLALVTVILVIIQVIGQSILAAMSHQEADMSPSEPVSRAQTQAFHYAYIVLATGAFVALFQSVMGLPGLWIFQSIVFFFVLAELTRLTSAILLLRHKASSQGQTAA